MEFKFDAIAYYVSDLDRASRFYSDVLGFQPRSRDFVARFDMNGVLFELVPTSDSSKLQGCGNGRLCLEVDDVNHAIEYLRARNVPASAAEPKNNGVLATFHDPDGNEIFLWQYTA